MKKLLLILLVFALSNCNNNIDPDDITVTPIDGVYIFDGYIDGYQFQTDSVTYYPSSNLFVFGDRPQIMISVDTLCECTFDISEFQGCVTIETPDNSWISWCSSTSLSSQGTLTITEIGDSTISATVDYIITTTSYPDGNGGYGDSTVHVTGTINAYYFGN